MPSESKRKRETLLGVIEIRAYNFVGIRIANSLNADIFCKSLKICKATYARGEIALGIDNVR